MSKNNWLVQFLSDIINLKVDTSKIEETTALGAAYMAGLKKGIYKSLNDISKNWRAIFISFTFAFENFVS